MLFYLSFLKIFWIKIIPINKFSHLENIAINLIEFVKYFGSLIWIPTLRLFLSCTTQDLFMMKCLLLFYKAQCIVFLFKTQSLFTTQCFLLLFMMEDILSLLSMQLGHKGILFKSIITFSLLKYDNLWRGKIKISLRLLICFSFNIFISTAKVSNIIE